jgi:xanthine phosphoribosyltransferase
VKQRALLKARTVQKATGAGAIATATAAYLEAEVTGNGIRPASEVLLDVEMDDRLDILVERLRPQSRSNERAVIYQAAACFVAADGEEIHGYAELSMPIEFADSTHTTIPISAALDKLLVHVSDALDLKFVGSDAFDDFYAMQEELKNGQQRKKQAGALLLRQKILREATVLDLDILKVSSFLNHMVDVELMEACGDELAERLQGTHPTKILTVETTGLLPAVFISKALGIPLVFARKSRQIGVSDSYQASYRSQTKATSQDLYVSTEYLNPGDRILLVDDFLAGGATADAMVRLCCMANAKVVGGGFLIEKLNDVGRAFLSGYQIPLEALCAVSIDNGNIVIAEDDTAPSRGDSLRGRLDALNLAKADELDALKAGGEYADEPESGTGTVYGSGA